MAIHCYTEACSLKFKNRRFINRWIRETILNERRKPGDIAVIFCSDEYLLSMNREHLNHDYYTDIITFDYVEGDRVSGDLFISVDTVRDNAEKYHVDFLHELHRVIIHGVLHLCGYQDKSPKQAKQMREKEDFYLNLLSV